MFALATVAAIGTWAMLRSPAPPAATRPAASETPWGPVGPEWTAAAAYDRGSAFSANARYPEALPLLHHAAADARAPWFVHFDYASTLHQFAMLPWNADHPRVAPRSSFERVQTMKRSSSEFATAGSLAAEGRDVAHLLWAHGQVWNTWGFPWESVRAFNEAAALDPGRAADAERYAGALNDPVGSGGNW